MKNLYDLLGARPDDGPENVRKAYREAAKTSHPDHHGGDRDAAARFRQIVEAYEILRDAEQRAAYDRLLEFERRPLRHKLKRFLSEMKRHVAYDLIAGILLAVVLAVGYELFARFPETFSDRAVTAAGVASAANDPDQLEMTTVEPASNPTRQTSAVAGRGSESDVPTGAGRPGTTQGEPPSRHDVPSVDTPLSAVEERNGVPAADDRRDGKTSEPAGANAGDVKIPEIKVFARPLKAVKRRAPRRLLVEQASLDKRNTSACAGSQSCSVSVPPFFGVGP